MGGGKSLSNFLNLKLVTALGDKAKKDLLKFMEQKHTFPGREKEILKNI